MTSWYMSQAGRRLMSCAAAARRVAGVKRFFPAGLPTDLLGLRARLLLAQISMICSSLNRLPFIVRLHFRDGLYLVPVGLAGSSPVNTVFPCVSPSHIARKASLAPLIGRI